jgi:hypothetical protein
MASENAFTWQGHDTKDQFDPDSVNFLLRDLQSGWLRRFDEAK